MSTKKSDSAKKIQVRISVSHTTGDLSSESALSAADIQAAVNKALSSGEALSLEDLRGHLIIVPAAKIGFVEIGEQTDRRVGFGAL